MTSRPLTSSTVLLSLTSHVDQMKLHESNLSLLPGRSVVGMGSAYQPSKMGTVWEEWVLSRTAHLSGRL